MAQPDLHCGWRSRGHAPATNANLALLLLVAGLVTGGCKKWAEMRAAERREAQAVHAQEAPPVIARPNGPGLTPGTYRIVEVRAEAQPSNPKGKPWDDASGPDPDLKLVVRADGKSVAECSSIKNSRFGRCKFEVDIDIDAGTQIEVDVHDEDDIVDDPIGSANLTEPSAWGLGMDLPLVPSGRLRAATLVFARTPSWWEVHRYQLVGLASGIGIALALVAAFRKTLLARLPPPLPTPRCQHCGVELPAHIANCSACGHIQRGGPTS